MSSPSLRWLQGWAYRQWTLETPSLDHAVSRLDEGGAPQMKGAVARYLHLTGKDTSDPAFDVDEDGRYRTPLRAAMRRIRDPWLRLFLRDIVPEQLNPSLICARYDIPKPVESWVMHAALTMLWREYRAAPLPQRSWVDQSDSQRNAILAGDIAAA